MILHMTRLTLHSDVPFGIVVQLVTFLRSPNPQLGVDPIDLVHQPPAEHLGTIAVAKLPRRTISVKSRKSNFKSIET